MSKKLKSGDRVSYVGNLDGWRVNLTGRSGSVVEADDSGICLVSWDRNGAPCQITMSTVLDFDLARIRG